MAEKKTKVNAEAIRGMSESDAIAQLQTLRKDLWQTRVKIQEGALQQGHEVRAMRRQIARIMTIQAERKAKGKA